jgi:hypothetical protein
MSLLGQTDSHFAAVVMYTSLLMFVYEALIRFLANINELHDIIFLKRGRPHCLFTHKMFTKVEVTWSSTPRSRNLILPENTALIKYRHEMITYAHAQHFPLLKRLGIIYDTFLFSRHNLPLHSYYCSYSYKFDD